MEIIKLLAVKGYYQEGNSWTFVEEKSWTGTAILRKDLTFEGIVVDYSKTTSLDRLISGTLADYNGTSLVKFSNHDLCPCSFVAMSTGKENFGGWSTHDYFNIKSRGRCKIVFTEIPMDEIVIKDITSRIETFKAEMDVFSRDLYRTFIENVDETVAKFISNIEEHRNSYEKLIGKPLRKMEF